MIRSGRHPGKPVKSICRPLNHRMARCLDYPALVPGHSRIDLDRLDRVLNPADSLAQCRVATTY